MLTEHFDTVQFDQPWADPVTAEEHARCLAQVTVQTAETDEDRLSMYRAWWGNDYQHPEASVLRSLIAGEATY